MCSHREAGSYSCMFKDQVCNVRHIITHELRLKLSSHGSQWLRFMHTKETRVRPGNLFFITKQTDSSCRHNSRCGNRCLQWLLVKAGQEPIDRESSESGSRRVRVPLLACSGSTTKTPVSSERANKRSRKTNRWSKPLAFVWMGMGTLFVWDETQTCIVKDFPNVQYWLH